MNMQDRLLETLLLGIVATRGENGATIAEMRADYEGLMYEPWPLEKFSAIEETTYLNNISGLQSVISPTGAFIYHVDISLNLPTIRCPPANGAMPREVNDDGSNAKAPPLANKIHTITEELSNVHLRDDYWLPQTIGPKPATADRNYSVNSGQRNEAAVLASKSDAVEKVPPKPPRSRLPLQPLPANGQDLDSQSSGRHSNGTATTTDTMSNHAPRYNYSGQAPNLSSGRTCGQSNSSTSSTGVYVNFCSEDAVSAHTSSSRLSNECPAMDIQIDGSELIWPFELSNRLRNIPAISPTPSISSLPLPGKKAATFYEWELMGDDLFLAMAKVELGCVECPSLRPRRCGLCASGQTLQTAKNYLLREDTVLHNKKIIINLGTIDIIAGHDMLDMKFDYERLVNACELRGAQPIITTLAPLSYSRTQITTNQNQLLRSFNQFLRDRYSKEYTFVDIWNEVADQAGNAISDCYQPYAVRTSGRHNLQLWNRLGRGRVLNLFQKVLY